VNASNNKVVTRVDKIKNIIEQPQKEKKFSEYKHTLDDTSPN